MLSFFPFPSLLMSTKDDRYLSYQVALLLKLLKLLRILNNQTSKTFGIKITMAKHRNAANSNSQQMQQMCCL